MRLGAAVLLALVLLVPTAVAHLQDARPVLQRVERERTVDIRMDGVKAVVDLSQTVDPLRETVRHVLDPARGRFMVEHRADASAAEDAFNVTWELSRLVEYRDQNFDGRFQPSVDTVVRAWRLQNYRWNVTGPATVNVGGVEARGVIWEGSLSGAPPVRLEAAIAGREFADEGARVRPQDVILYFDVRGLPARSAGNLYAIEGTVSFPAPAKLSPALAAGNATTGALVDLGPRRALFIHGGEAVLDGKEQPVPLTLDASHEASSGTSVAAMRIHIPITDRAMRFVLVSGMEYELPTERTPTPGLLLLLASVASAALARRVLVSR